MNRKLPPFIKAPHSMMFDRDRPNNPNKDPLRMIVLPIGVLFVFLVFAARLFQLTVVKGTYYQHIAENNRIKEYRLDGERGIIYDRKGLILAQSEQIDQTQDEVDESTNDSKTTDTNTDKDQTDDKDALTQGLPYTRTYSSNRMALAHILGYRSIASEDILEQDACKEPLYLNDKVGVKGVEQTYECYLRPTKGKRLVEVDSMGNHIKTLSQVEPRPGKNIKLSIDSELQQKAYEVIMQNDITTTVETDLSDHKIAVIAMDPKTGELLMMMSYPSYDPQDFEDNTDKAQDYLTDEEQPLFNRALLGTYPPGSVFKPMVAAAALEDEVISETDTIEDNGFIDAGPQRFHNWLYTKYGRTDGLVDLRTGLQRSNDIYFYKIGEKLSAERLKAWAHTFGFGKSTGVDLPEADGVIPTDFWKRETIGEKWYLGDTYNFSIGQGYFLTTPLQILRATAAFANDGKLCKPQLLKLDDNMNADVLESTDPECSDLNLSEDTITAVREGMKQACEAEGTAWPFFTFNDEDGNRIPIGCKTGTAESHTVDGLPHAWFTIFAPYENPEIVMTVLVEEAGEGSNIAAPIAKEVLQDYFDRTE